MLVLLIILGAVLVWRGPKMLPRWGATLGRGVREARREANEAREDIQRRLDADDKRGDDDTAS